VSENKCSPLHDWQWFENIHADGEFIQRYTCSREGCTLMKEVRTVYLDSLGESRRRASDLALADKLQKEIEQ
jgi:hypothetical protein